MNGDTEVDWNELSPPAKIRTLHCLKDAHLFSHCDKFIKHLCVVSRSLSLVPSASIDILHVYPNFFSLELKMHVDKKKKLRMHVVVVRTIEL